MKKGFIFILITITLPLSTFLQAKENGGFVPCLATCLIGPRVGLEMNEGKDINQSEWIALGGSILASSLTMNGTYYTFSNINKDDDVRIFPKESPATGFGRSISIGTRLYMAYDMGNKNGFEGVLASYCLGPRIGSELDYRKIRTIEWLQLVPCVCIYPAIAIPLQAYNGKTMTEIEVEEGLRK
ncbi:MAG: hypothetical protein KAU06_00190 [Candidatus Marinimicrobia bacterium]|nr:hypothetical protein [Candidatus Neomarinimicrobiota bacterium]